MVELANSPLLFLCYAREDKREVDAVYLALREAGFSPWMDKPPKPYHLTGIAPGVEWEYSIRRKINEADFFIAFLSNASISKRGFVQKEFRLALKVANEVPPERYYLLPVLLEPCRPPDLSVDAVRLHERQWYPLYEYGLDGLISHIRSAWSGVQPSKNDVENAYLRIEKSFRPHLFYGGQGHHLDLGLQLSFMITNLSERTLTLVPPEIEVENPTLQATFRYWRVDTGSGRQTVAVGKGRTAWVKAEFDLKADDQPKEGDQISGSLVIKVAQPDVPGVPKRFSATYDPDLWDA